MMGCLLLTIYLIQRCGGDITLQIYTVLLVTIQHKFEMDSARYAFVTRS